MNKTDLKLASILLKKAADEFSNHGCNDFHLEDDAGLNEEQIKELESGIQEWMKDPEFQMNGPWAQDWVVMSYLADKIGKNSS